ncbi:MAG: redoxin domain-containing protein [Gemmatimonadaceae bacterium]
MTATQTVPSIGAEAPDFTLPSTSGSDVMLSSFRDKSAVLLAFFPLAFTSTCTEEMCAFRDDYDEFVACGVAVLPISVDSVPTLKEFKTRHNMKTDLLSDFKRTVGERYGVMWQDSFFTNRAYFLIDTDGIIRWAHVEETPGNKRESSEILTQIGKLEKSQ